MRKNCIGQSRRVVTATINCPVVRITQRKHSISRAWILITTQIHETGFKRRMVKSRSREGRRKNHEERERSQLVSTATPAAREERLRCEIRDVRNASPSSFSEALEGGRGYGGGRGEGHDGVDGDLKGNERGMMQVWVKIAAWRQGMVSANEQEKRERRDVRVGEWCSESLCIQQWRPIVWRLDATIRSYGTVSAFSCTLPVRCAARRMPLTIMHSLLRRQIIRS